MYEIAGAINRINNPGWTVIEYALWTSSSSFFRNKPNIGIDKTQIKKLWIKGIFEAVADELLNKIDSNLNSILGIGIKTFSVTHICKWKKLYPNDLKKA